MRRERSSIYNKALLAMLAVGVLAPSMAVDVGTVHAAETEGVSINTLAAGDIIKFAGKEWTLLDPATGYIHMNILQKLAQGTMFDPEGTQKFDPSDVNNIGYWLNTTWYNTLSADEQSVIVEKDWGIGSVTANEGGFKSGAPWISLEAIKVLENREVVTAKVGLLSVSEYRKQSKYHTGVGGIIDRNSSEYTWLITPLADATNAVWQISSEGLLDGAQTMQFADVMTVRPSMNILAGTKVSADGTVLPGEGLPPTSGPGAGDSQTATLNLEGGDLTIETAEIKDFGSIKLKNQPQTVTTGFDDKFTVTDNRGTGLGWRLDVSATTFSEVAPVGGFVGGAPTGFTLPIGSLMINGLDSIERTEGAPGGNPSIAGLNNTVIDGSSLATVSNAGLNEGAGKFGLTFGEDALSLVVDSSTAKVDTLNYPTGATPYESTVTWDLVSAP